MKIQRNKVLKVSLLALLAFVLLFFVFRNSLLHFVLDKKIQQYEKKYQTQIQIKEASFYGLSSLLIRGITIAPSTTDTLLHIDSVNLRIRILPLFTLKIRFSNLEIRNSYLQLIKKDNKSNYSFLMKSKKELPIDSTIKNKDYGLFAEQMINTIFDIIPSSVNFKNSQIEIENDSVQLKVELPNLEIREHHFTSKICFYENKKSQIWMSEGTINAGDKNVDLKIFPLEKTHAEIPLLLQKWKLLLSFDTLQMNLNSMEYAQDQLHLSGSLSSQNMCLNHWRISPHNVVIKNQSMNFLVHVGANFVALDSSSTIVYNKVTYHPFLKYQGYPRKQFQLDAHFDACKAQDFFDSFPEGLFENIDGLKISGDISYRLHFFLDIAQPDALEFSSYLGKRKLKILGFGNTVLTKINGEFTYTAYDKERAIRTFPVGPSNPNYTPINQISNLLKTALLTSEDGNFYSHSGFNEDAFRKSIITNFKEKRFVRGGSTVSMQLVKNVFLTRNKTVARKIEEALIVWLIESNRLSSKERMYEVYLNLIEWGPNVFGIGEASRFYFDKSPADLSLAESIYLAMIVPRPKAFKYSFGPDGKLKESVSRYFTIVAEHMLKRGSITEEEKNALVPNVELKGPSKSMIMVTDSLLPEEDTEEEFAIPN
jgi:Transglycosylase